MFSSLYVGLDALLGSKPAARVPPTSGNAAVPSGLVRRFILRVSPVAIGLSLVLTCLRFVEFDLWILLGLVPIAPWVFLAVSITTAAFYDRRAFVVVLIGSGLAVLLAMPGALMPRTGCTTANATAENDVVVYSHNAKFGGANPDAIAAQIELLNADVVVIQEGVPDFIERFAPLLDEHPHFIQRGLLSVFSRWEFADDGGAVDAPDIVGALATVVDTPAGPIRVVNVHSPWPLLPGGRDVQIGQFELLSRVLYENEAMPVVAIGDYNATPADARYRSLASADPARGEIVDAHRVAGCGFGVTWTPLSGFRPSLLSLDHAIVSGASVEGFEILDSAGGDHKGIAVHVSLDD